LGTAGNECHFLLQLRHKSPSLPVNDAPRLCFGKESPDIGS
jgi:hypothetical protein